MKNREGSRGKVKCEKVNCEGKERGRKRDSEGGELRTAP